jgi:carboxyl-terminal processing protease
MDNQFNNEDDYNNKNQFNVYNQRKNKRKSKHDFGLGAFTGVVCTLLVMIIIVGAVFVRFYQAGYIHIATNGQIYIQDIASSASNGIGSEVEAKLNAMDSVLDTFYFDDVDEETAKDNIYKAYLSSYGDKYTVYYTADEYKSLLESTTGKFSGIGAVCQKMDNGTILITEAYEEAPAYKAGIRKGDYVSKVEGQDITDMDLSTAVALIKGEKGTSVHLEVIRDDTTFECDVVRDDIDIRTVSYSMRENDIGYILISQFDTVTTNQFKSALDDLTAQGMKGLVIDIRSNPGGVLGTVVDMLDEILPDGLIVYTQDKDGNKTEYKGSNKNELTVPLAVLVDGNSASASEIFAGAVQDYGIGNIIGTQTFGKGIVQTIRPMTDGSAIKYTIAKYFTPKGQDIHGNGVTPDIVIEYEPSDDGSVDNQLEAAMDYVKSQINN